MGTRPTAVVYGLAIAGASTVRALQRHGYQVVVADDVINGPEQDLATGLGMTLLDGASVDAAAWLNLQPDHLNWHRSMDSSEQATTQIFANQRDGGIAIGNVDDDTVVREVEAATGRATPVEVVETLVDAVPLAGRCARPGDVVPLSPGSASLVQFKNYEARGDHFRALVNSIVNTIGAS